MENKLQALTDKLYQDGLSKGKEEGERILAENKKLAEQTLLEAEKTAREIVEKAKKDAEDLRKNAETDIAIASRQMLSKLKQDTEEALMNKTLAPAVKAALEDKQFVQNLIVKALDAFKQNQTGGMALELLLAETDRTSFDGFIKGSLGSALQNGLEVKFSGDLQGGFKIVSKSQGYQLSFTEEDFMALFKEYARPRIKQMLF